MFLRKYIHIITRVQNGKKYPSEEFTLRVLDQQIDTRIQAISKFKLIDVDTERNFDEVIKSLKPKATRRRIQIRINYAVFRISWIRCKMLRTRNKSYLSSTRAAVRRSNESQANRIGATTLRSILLQVWPLCYLPLITPLNYVWD